jgi:hypothetical protein
MASLLHDDDALKVGPGILMPMLQHRFQVRFKTFGFGETDLALLTASAVNVKMDFKNKTVRFDIQQPAAVGDMMVLIEELVAQPRAISVCAMDGGDGVIHRVEFTSLECVSHAYDLDYSKGSAVAHHEMVMSYGMMKVV